MRRLYAQRVPKTTPQGVSEMGDLIGMFRQEALKLPLESFRRRADGSWPPFPGDAPQPGTLDAAGAALVLSNHPRHDDDRALARGIVARLVTGTLERDPERPAFGTYTRRFGDPLEEIADRNWGAFVGSALLQILQHAPRGLSDWPEADRRLLEEGVRLPALAAVKRDVRVGYTNVVLISIYLALGAGRLLPDAELRRAGEEKLDRFLCFHRSTGSFEEYASPTYAALDLSALVGLADLEKDGPLAALTSGLLHSFLQHLTRHYHLPTGELGGPHSRAYADTLREHSQLPVFLRAAGVPPYGELAASRLGVMPSTWVACPAAVPGIKFPKELRRGFEEPAETRDLVEWVGRDTSLPAPEGTPRFRMTTTYRERAFVLGTVNEMDVWHQRRNCIAYWRAPDGTTTGIRLGVEIDCPHLDESHPYGIWPLQMGMEALALQDGARVLGAVIRADVAPVRKGDILQAPSAYMGIGREDLLLPRSPAAWLLGTHWRQPVEAGEERLPVAGIEIAFAPLGPGEWRRLADDLFEFASGEVRALIRVGRAGARVEGGRLVLASMPDIEWDWLGGPFVLVPYALVMGRRELEPPPPVTAEERAGRVRAASGDMEIVRRRISSPAKVEERTWFGTVAAREVLPPRP